MNVLWVECLGVNPALYPYLFDKNVKIWLLPKLATNGQQKIAKNLKKLKKLQKIWHQGIRKK